VRRESKVAGFNARAQLGITVRSERTSPASELGFCQLSFGLSCPAPLPVGAVWPVAAVPGVVLAPPAWAVKRSRGLRNSSAFGGATDYPAPSLARCAPFKAGCWRFKSCARAGNRR
jgi:hypothetical protein